jgi:hypothetical protein
VTWQREGFVASGAIADYAGSVRSNFGCPDQEWCLQGRGSRRQGKIEITAPRKVGTKKEFENAPESGTVGIVTEAIPARYNQKSELKMTVQRGTNSQDFDLKSR